MKLTGLLLLGALIQVQATGLAQSVTISGKNMRLKSVLREVKSQTGFFIFYPNRDIVRIAESHVVSLDVRSMPLNDFLDMVFNENSLTYKIEAKTISVLIKPNPAVITADLTTQVISLTGRVTDVEGRPVEGATISVKSSRTATMADGEGRFKLDGVPDGARLIISSVGFMPVTVRLQGKSITVEATDAVQKRGATQEETEGNAKSTANMDAAGFLSVKLARLVKKIETVIVTGIVNKRKESFTGSAATYSQEELRQVGGTNILQSLKTLDPAFAIRENTLIGSDPNRLPNLEIRGKTSLIGTRDELSMDPNQPLFILDGFESSLAAINDLDINRVESITILKDAASAALYGSKAANGVVVVETVKPKAGKLQVRYTGNTNIQAPDLTSYNLMNAAEKVEFERLAGRFDSRSENTGSAVFLAPLEVELAQLYNDRLRMLAEGINTYWLAEPLRVGLSQKHSLYVAGGEGNFLFGLGGGYNGITGVMKGSERKVLNGNIDLTYRVSKFQFSNKLSISTTRFQNPIVPFREYASANPYYKKTNNGVVEQWLENSSLAQIGNPLWNASLNSRDKGQNMQLTNFFISEWRPTINWLVRARFGLTFDNNNTEKFFSPEDTRQMLKETINRGEFTTTNNNGNRYEGDLMVGYNRLINKHRINLVGGSNINSSTSLLHGYTVEGFPGGNYTYPNFSRGFRENSRPSYQDNISRSLNGYFNAGYAFDDRYLMDLNLRSSGSSIFGSNRKFNNTWSVGLGWNLHREQFIISNMSWINFLKIRGSVGNPGNQNFESGQTLRTYRFLSGLQSYFGLASTPDQLGNPDLEWQITQDKNIGMDLTAFNNRFSLNVDYFHKVTSPQLISIDMPLSSGTSQFLTNSGEQISRGINFSTSYQILRNIPRRILWSVRANGRTQKTRIYGIGDKLNEFNNNGKGSSTTRYIDGADPDDIWAMKSLGIDPSNGKELFLTKDGKFTYDFSYDDEVIVGNRRPDLEGILGSSFTLGGFTINLNFRYQFGAEIFNSVLRQKVENVDMLTNQDRRALYDRWQKPGDIKHFKNLKDINQSPITSRFVQTDKSFNLESFYAEYQFTDGWVKKVGLGNLRIFASARDVFTISTIRAERGIEYPFARVFDAGLSFNF